MKYGILFWNFAAVLFYVAVARSGIWLILMWPAIGTAIIAAGYLGFGASVYGKRQNGALAWWSSLVHLPYLVLLWFIWRVGVIFSSESAMHRITNRLTVGRRLQSSEVPTHFDHYVDLTAEFMECGAARRLPGYCCFPILDGGEPDIEPLKDLLDRLEGNVYVHCAQGHGRTGLFAILLLARWKEIKTFQEGLELLQSKRPELDLNKTQKLFVMNYLENMVDKEK